MFAKFTLITILASTTAGSAFAQQAPASSMIDASNVKIEGNTIMNVAVDIDRPGYLVIHNEGAGAPPASLGHIAVVKGMTGNLNIESDQPLDPNSGLSLMLHYETNGNTTYDFGPGSTDVDGPVKVGDAVIAVPIKAAM